MRDAAVKLGVTPRKIDRLIEQGIFSVQRDGLGRGCHRLLMVDEIEAYKEANCRGFDAARAAVRELRKREGRIK